ncbi:RIC1-domain-containing protein [Viridothelium virens]|uniref:RIC1-domain-containing protein n=1 Tax=Viridothelium virens TaxID=1048519 RepID=A0A6A6HA76_VIRVR|nr:RIC1-domain-containing protein [Viridothelium virens]
MYWPLGTPRVHAVSKQPLQSQATQTDDGASRIDTESSVDKEPHQRSTDRQQSIDRSDPAAISDEESENETGSTAEDKLLAPETRKRQSLNLRSISRVPRTAPYDAHDNGEIIAMRIARTGHIFVTITRTSLFVWQTRPTVVLASVIRSPPSLQTYGSNTSVSLRPDSLIVVVQTELGFLITYSVATDPSAIVYRQQQVQATHSRRHSITNGIHRSHGNRDPGAGDYIPEINVRFRMVLKIDAGIGRTLALDDELVVSTIKPAAVQCIRWTPDTKGSQTSTELISKMTWISNEAKIIDMVHDRPMNLSTWVTDDGKAYAVQRVPGASASPNPKRSVSMFKGYCFHSPKVVTEHGVKVAINARFSLVAIGCANGNIVVYTARDYDGNIPLSHTLRPVNSADSLGTLTCLTYSPDGHCLFAGYARGWMTWSVYGKLTGSSFSSDSTVTAFNDEKWLTGVHEAFWMGGGSSLLILSPADDRLWTLEMARSATTGCFSPDNISRPILQTDGGFMLYRGYEVADLTAISMESSLWHHVQIPAGYLADQWPIRCLAVSADGRYVAVAGRRGLAHYSVSSGRWKMFDDTGSENEFAVRGGMCWHQHILFAAVETDTEYQLRLFSREKQMDENEVLHIENFEAPIIHITLSGDDSLLVYTYENVLFHYVIGAVDSTVTVTLVGQIGLQGIIRAPPRVRSVSWIVPEEQLQQGDPSQDVATATVLFLVDGKLVLLQPSANEQGELKYDMRVIASNVEYYSLMRDQEAVGGEENTVSLPFLPDGGLKIQAAQSNGLRDSLWYFDGSTVRVWTDIQDVLSSVPQDLGRDLPAAVLINVDFYPLCALVSKGILFGVESELVQRRDLSFAFWRFATRTHLFLPPLLRHHLSQYDSPAALHLSHHYQKLPYFPHALEVLLHDVLDDEVETAPPPETALLPSILSFLSSFPQYLDIIVQCTRKTEVRSWRTLFAYLPSPQELFEESLDKGSLKTAGGYLLVLHNLEDLHTGSNLSLRLLRRATEVRDWELCKELARFLMALDESGSTLREALAEVDVQSRGDGEGAARLLDTQPSPTRQSMPITAGTNGAHGAHARGMTAISAGPHSPRSADADNGAAGTYSTRGGGDYFESLPGS